MSAVGAVLYLEPSRWDESAALQIVEAVAARAPDGRRSWSGRPAGLGHGALHTTAENAAERLPLQRGDGELAITADARCGELCPERLLGDFSFAIWDRRRTALICACDRFAVKPLYWHRSDRLAAVATEVKDLLALG